MFSPYYAAARRRGMGNPYDHCAFNVALYGKRGKHWAMTERRSTSLQYSQSSLQIGPSSMSWDGNALTIDIAEFAVPRFTQLHGRIRLHPVMVTSTPFHLDPQRRHVWQPIAPRARVEVEMQQPGLRWSGSGYFDTNTGTAPLEDDFRSWTWSRADTKNGACILYDVNPRAGDKLSLALDISSSGEIKSFTPPATVNLPLTGWRVGRETRSELPSQTAVLKTLEDTPFYARSEIRSQIGGAVLTAMHESLSLDRFANRVVQAMLPFRMPRELKSREA